MEETTKKVEAFLCKLRLRLGENQMKRLIEKSCLLRNLEHAFEAWCGSKRYELHNQISAKQI